MSYDLAPQIEDATVPRSLIVIAGLLAPASAALGLIARLRGWKKG